MGDYAYVANAIAKSDFEHQMLANVAAHLVRQYPDLSGDELKRHVFEAKRLIDARLPDNQTVLSQDDVTMYKMFANILGDTTKDVAGSYGPAVTAVQEAYSAYLEIQSRQLDPDRYVDAQKFQADHVRALNKQLED